MDDADCCVAMPATRLIDFADCQQAVIFHGFRAQISEPNANALSLVNQMRNAAKYGRIAVRMQVNHT
jgi:hypothetical protein